MDFGVFAELTGLTTLLHSSEISYLKNVSPKNFKVGDKIGYNNWNRYDKKGLKFLTD